MAATACPGKHLYPLVPSLAFAPQPPEVPVADNPKLVSPILGFYPIVKPDTGECTGYYFVSVTGEVNAFGSGAKFFGRPEAPAS